MTQELLHSRMLALATRAAWRGIGNVEPNPPVGCVIGTNNGRVIAIGYHKRFGHAHAEVNALARCKDQSLEPAGKTAWVTLEPCSHTGKTPPCADALIRARLARVVYAVSDPHPEASGGAARLRNAGIEVLHVPHRAAQVVTTPYLLRVREARPFVIGKWAQSLDGCISTSRGDSKWISNPSSRRHVHRLRGSVDAILTGIGTVLADDPLLNVREVYARRQPLRVVVDPNLRTPPQAKLLSTASVAPVVIACLDEHANSTQARTLEQAGAAILPVPEQAGGLDLSHLLAQLWQERAVATIMTECGPGLMRSLLDASLLDMLQIYIAPLLFGDAKAHSPLDSMPCAAIADASRFTLVRTHAKGDDMVATYFAKQWL
jgi:diaminohydroxyphosphoribosylaminopyrimidine deaminase / 5-amino-6-(5-phosphoribosylamino)uracil reductase